MLTDIIDQMVVRIPLIFEKISPAFSKTTYGETGEMSRIAQNMSEGVIEPSTSAWSSPVVLVAIKYGDVRFCRLQKTE